IYLITTFACASRSQARESAAMTLPPIFDHFRKLNVQFVTNAGKFSTNCPKCKRPNTNHIELDDDGEGVRMHCDCGFTEIKRLRPAGTPSNGGKTGVPFMLPEAQKRELRALGYTEEEILHLTPEEGLRLIAEQCKASDWRERRAFEAA